MEYRKGNLYRFKEELRQSKGAPKNIFSLISHFIDDQDKTEKLILRDSGTLDSLIANASDMEPVNATYEEKLLFCLTDIGESLRVIAQSSNLAMMLEEEEEEVVEEVVEPPKRDKKKTNVH